MNHTFTAVAALVPPARSPHWPAVRRAHLKKHPACAACGRRDHVQVHHIHPYWLFPEMELDPQNLITLDEAPGVEHHYRLGHGGHSWHDFNPHVVAGQVDRGLALVVGGPQDLDFATGGKRVADARLDHVVADAARLLARQGGHHE